MMNRTLRFFCKSDGSIPVLEWLHSLRDSRDRKRIQVRLDRITLGNLGDYKAVGKGVSELRLHFGPGYRVYCAEDGHEVVILLCGGDKSSQSEDIAKAHAYWQSYLGTRKEHP